MKRMFKYALYIPILIGLLTFAACSDDDDDPIPVEPSVSLNTSASDAFRGGTVTISGTVTAPGGFTSLTADGSVVTNSGATVGSTEVQNFSFDVTVDEAATVGSTITVSIVATDAIAQTSDAVTYTITVVPQGAPTVVIDGAASSDAKRREVVTIALDITAAEGIDELVVTDGDGNNVATVDGGDISDPSNFSWEYTIPDGATVGGDIVLNHSVTDNAGQTTATAAVYTITVLEFDAPTVEFTEFDSGIDSTFNEDTDYDISLTISKDELVAWQTLTVVRLVNGDAQTPEELDISDEMESTITYTLSIEGEFLDEVELSLKLSDEFDNETDVIELNYDVLTTTGASYLIDDVDVNGTSVKRVRGNITADETFMSSNNYWLGGEVEVSDGATLTIQAGTTIYAEPGIEAALDIDDSGSIMATGTAVDPIVFTSGAAIDGGTPEAGDWAFVQIGGADGVNSGTFQYVRIEYGGEGEVPAFELDLVDASTTISHVQVFESSDQGIEVNGGNVHLSHIVVTSAADISIEFDDDDDVGFTGSMQYAIIESSEILTKGGRDLEIRDNSNPTLANLTLLGSGRDTPDGDISGVRIRSSAAGLKFYNMIIAEYSDDGFRQDNVSNISDINGSDVVAHSFIFRILDQPTRDDNDDPVTGKPGPLDYETDGGFMNTVDADNTPVAAAGIGVADFVPDALITSGFDPTTLGSAFGAGTYIGAIGSMDWTVGWTLNADGTVR